MFDMSAITSAKKKVSVNQDESTEKYDKLVSDGLKDFQEFMKNFDQRALQSAAKNFLNAISIKRTQVEPFVYMSMIYLLSEKSEDAIRYYLYAQSIDSGHQDVNNLKQVILENKLIF